MLSTVDGLRDSGERERTVRYPIRRKIGKDIRSVRPPEAVAFLGRHGSKLRAVLVHEGWLQVWWRTGEKKMYAQRNIRLQRGRFLLPPRLINMDNRKKIRDMAESASFAHR